MHRLAPPARVATASTENYVDDTPVYGPHLPSDRDAAAAVAANLTGDAWVHPLAGPMRRMPSRRSRAFGAERQGNRPFECRSGHCGVDLGGSIWGEPIHSVHRGVIDKINRDPSRSGGKYIRIAHRDGTVFSQYFHLAAIPRRLRLGSSVQTGQVIGLLGETGVDHSGPHLHFTISVQPNPDSREFYIDPEPLVALWPVVVPRIGGAPETELRPGVPVGATGRYKKARRRSRSGPTVPRESQPAPLAAGDAMPESGTDEVAPVATAE